MSRASVPTVPHPFARFAALSRSPSLGSQRCRVYLHHRSRAAVCPGNRIPQLRRKLRTEIVRVDRGLVPQGVEPEEINGGSNARIDGRETTVEVETSDVWQDLVAGQAQAG